MPELPEQPLIAHLEALRRTLLHMLAATALLFPAGYLLAPQVIDGLVGWCCPPELGSLSYFSPMEVFLAQLKLALVLALALAFPYNLYQLWKFLLPALYRRERRMIGGWIAASSGLFAVGVGFCALLILPLLMRFAAGFAGDRLRPVIGLSNFLELAGWLMLSFGLMFQLPLAVIPAVRFGLVSTATLRRSRPYAVTAILIVAAVLTPPDVVSQLLLAVPTWLLWEGGIWVAARFEPKEKTAADPQTDDGSETFYRREAERDAGRND